MIFITFCHCIKLVNIYAVPVSTVPSESAFSVSNRVLTDDRNRLGNKTFEIFVCLKDWFDARSKYVW
jgi:hAT family C-terminal dimerisation region